MDISAEIKAIKYKPHLCKKLREVSYSKFKHVLSKNASFILNIDKTNKFAVSWWVSAKRTRSYPYSRVYNSLDFSGKKVTIIPIFKDEGKEGDRDFLQWDTVALMSLLGVNTVISYYTDAQRSSRYAHKITKQRFNITHLKKQLSNLLSYQSDALHWNLQQVDNVGKIGQKALASYQLISRKLGVEMHSKDTAQKRIDKLLIGKQTFMNLSRDLAHQAQMRESVTTQPKEFLTGEKASLTIKNYLGGYYFFTADEAKIEGDTICLVECKHSKNSILPSLEDIKDGLIKMILFVNLDNVNVKGKNYNPIPILKLTSKIKFSMKLLRKSQNEYLRLLKKEAKENGFQVLINNANLEEIVL